MFSFDIQRFSSYVVYVDPASSSLSVTKDGVASEITGTVSINGTTSWDGRKYSLDEYEAVVNFMALKMKVEFEDGADVQKNCKKVEDDCKIFL